MTGLEVALVAGASLAVGVTVARTLDRRAAKQRHGAWRNVLLCWCGNLVDTLQQTGSLVLDLDPPCPACGRRDMDRVVARPIQQRRSFASPWRRAGWQVDTQSLGVMQ